MTTALRFLAGLLTRLPTFAFVYAPIQHVGDVVQHAPVELDESCGCDEPAPETFRIGEEALAALLEDGIAEFANGATREQARQHVMNALVMQGIAIDAEDE